MGLTKYITLLGLILGSTAIGISQSLEQFIEMSKSNSARVKALDTEYQAAKQVSSQVSAYPDPEVSLWKPD